MRINRPLMQRVRWNLIAITTFAGMAIAMPALAQREMNPGDAVASNRGDNCSLGNRDIEAKWSIAGMKLEDLKVTDLQHARTIDLQSPFSLRFADGRIVRLQDLHFVASPAFQEMKAEPDASRLSDRIGGKQFEGMLEDSTGDLRVNLSFVMRNGSGYLRQIWTISAPNRDLAIRDVRLVDDNLIGAQVVGSVSGSPIVDGNFYLGFEHPLSSSRVIRGHAVADLKRTLPLPKQQSITYSSVIGVAPAGQMPRAFLAYIERERAHPYRTFLHYNSWFDLGYFTPYNQDDALTSINAIGQELHDKRAVTLDSFLFDDGWDDHHTLWNFNSGFPHGFTPIREATIKYGAAPGIWLSPWGGYGKPKQERLQYGQKAGFEIVGAGFALSGPKYYARFRDACLQMIRQYGVNQFKFDGTGNDETVFPGSRFDSDFDAMIHLIGELRRVKPDIYINLTTGTYASPYWLFYADSIWRGGDDSQLAGVGTKRERWITYRDAATYAHVVAAGPLFPLNSLMLHGIIYARDNEWLNSDPGNDFANEVHSYFGTGTQLQELYLTPSLLTQANWDTLAEAAKWSRQNAAVLEDTHWVGGDPAWLAVYGWASWTPKKAILVLRNPSDRPQAIDIDLAKVFELPPDAPHNYSAKSPWRADAQTTPLILNADVPHRFELAPFQVLTLDMQPK